LKTKQYLKKLKSLAMKKIFFAVAVVCCLNTVAFGHGNKHKNNKQATKQEVKTYKKDCTATCPMTHCPR